MRIYDIKWDVTDSDHTIEEEHTLPKEVIISDPDEAKIIENMYDGDMAYYLSDEYGYDVRSFRVDQ